MIYHIIQKIINKGDTMVDILSVGIFKNELVPEGAMRVGWAKENVGWGVDVLDDPNQSIYVWIDALSNYITAIGYNPDGPSEQFEKLWPVDVSSKKHESNLKKIEDLIKIYNR